MKNYAAIADLKAKATFHIEKAFDRGYDQGYNDCKVELLEDEAKCHYQEGYNDGYRKGAELGKEARVAEADCAYQCGMNRAWKAARKLRHMEYSVLYKVFADDDIVISGIRVKGLEAVFEKYSASEAVEKIEAWEKKQEQTEKHCSNCDNAGEDAFACYECENHSNYESKQEQTEKNCDNCKYNNREKTSYPCAACLRKIDGRHAMWEAKKDYVRDATPEESKSVNDYIKSISKETGVTFGEKEEKSEKNCDTCKNDGWSIECACCGGVNTNYSKWTPKQDAPDMNVESIEVGDEVTYNIGNVMVVTRVYSESRSADLLRYDGTVEQQPLEILTPTGKHYDIQALFDAIKPSKPEKGGK